MIGDAGIDTETAGVCVALGLEMGVAPPEE